MVFYDRGGGRGGGRIPILDVFVVAFGQIQKSKIADQDGRQSEMITQLLGHVTSSPYDVDVKGDIFKHTKDSPNLVVIACIFSELQRGAESAHPGRRRPKKISLNWIKQEVPV